MHMPMNNAVITKAYKEAPPTGVDYAKGYHTGVDMFSADKIIYAPVAGKILKVAFDAPGWGKYVILRTKDNRYDLIFAHMKSQAVKETLAVEAGTKLGIMGATGQVTGAHLHFEVRKLPWTSKNDIDPCAWLGISGACGPVTLINTKKPGKITRFAVGDGYMEELPDRTIIHKDAYNYINFWKDGRREMYKDGHSVGEW